MRAAVLVIDMVRDTLKDGSAFPITPHARAIIPRINEINRWARNKGYPVVFACDSFEKDDFIFLGKMKPHSLRGTEGSLVAEELEQDQGDVYLPKRRFSAFFKTDLDQSLRNWKVDTVLVCGISTHFCVLTTTMDALCLDFQAVMVEDATAAPHPDLREKTLDLYRENPLFPLLRVLTAEEVYEL